jgi:hypothetical protein
MEPAMQKPLQELAAASDKRSPKTVAVVTMLGSLCPITLAHTQAFDEARKLLLDPNARPPGLERFDHVLGFISVNIDCYVSSKFPDRISPIHYDDRLLLAKLAISERQDWMDVEDEEGDTVHFLKRIFPTLKFVHFIMNGADDVIKNRKWRWADAKNRFITMGRTGATTQLLESMEQAGADFGPNFLLGPDLPDLSSTAARDAFERHDMEALHGMLHPKVIEWCLTKGPWRVDK